MAHAVGCPLPISGICSVVSRGGASIGSSIVSALLAAVVGWCASTAAWLLGLVGHALEGATAPPVTTSWFLAREHLLFGVAAPVALLALVAGVLRALVHGAMGELWRTVLLRLPVAVLLGAAGAGLVGLALSVTDRLSASLARGSGASLDTALRGLAEAVASSVTVPGAIAIVVAGLVILGALVLFVELVVRAAAITVVTAALPLVLAATLWPPAVAWARRLLETLGALIVSKAVIVLVLSIALDAIAHATAGPATALTGGALLLLATCMPYAVLRLVPLADAAGIAHLESVRHRATGATRPATGRAVSLAVAAIGGEGPMPSVDPVGADPVGMMPGLDVDLVAGTALDPDVRVVKGPPPVKAVPASAGTHVWERDHIGPRLVWKPPGHVESR
ncbi:MAG TPA: hypothetical protein VGZ03_10980 [Acidimicrobiales bacterium]|jgi:hypothetical protein|nr:hypothetical protein [Acidimicrobiales bacterium]